MYLIVINIVAVVNLLILSGFLFIRKSRSLSNILLAFILLDPALLMVFDSLVYYRVSPNYPFIYYIAYLYDFLWAPLFFYFVKLELQKEIKLTVRDVRNFSFFIVGALFFIWFSFQTKAYQKQMLIRTMSDNNYPWQFYVLDILTVIQVATCLYVCYRKVSKHNRQIEQVFSNIQYLSAKWLERSIVLSIIMCIALYFPSIIIADPVIAMFIVPVISLILYIYLVYNAINYPIVVTEENSRIINKTKEYSLTDIRQSEVLFNESPGLYGIIEDLLLKKQLYLDGDMNIQEFAQQCGVRVHILSAFINRHYNKNFYDFINYYRVEEAKKMLIDPEFKKYSISTIAEKAGFVSRSAFYNSFKKNTGQTPGDFVKTVDFQFSEQA